MALSKQDLINGLDQFYGSDTTYYQPIYPKYRYTEGVKDLAEIMQRVFKYGKLLLMMIAAR